MEKWWKFLHALTLATMLFQINGQNNTDGYLNIDCGLPTGQTYVDNTTGLTYTSDDQFVKTGEIHNISESYVNPLADKKYLNLRSFPSGNRNCYNLPTSPSTKYLLRTGFLYGNYDGQNSTDITFELNIGINFWTRVQTDNETQFELITLAPTAFTALCLVNIGSGTPSISFIEMRKLKSTMYVNVSSSQSFNLYRRYYMAPSTYPLIRYPDDAYDRIWVPWIDTMQKWKHIFTTDKVTNPPNDLFEVPSSVLQNAATNSSIIFYTNIPEEGYVVCHYAEIENITRENRTLFTYVNDDKIRDLNHITIDYYIPVYLTSGAVYPLKAYPPNFVVTLVKTNYSQLYDPLLNAVELFMPVQHRDAATIAEDLSAITNIMGQYDVTRNWIGDPCFPESYTWDGVGCNYSAGPMAISTTAIIISLNLSLSGLNGSISGDFSHLSSIKNLNLSYNNLTGSVPDSLAYLPYLNVLDLTHNCLRTIPNALRQLANAGKLTLRFEPQKEGCEVKDNPKKRRIIIIVVAVASAVVVAMLIGLLIYIQNLRLKASRTTARRGVVEWGDIGSATRFPKSQLEDIMNTYNRHLGGGGFGEVYYGKLEDEKEIAIKVLSNASTQGYKEFRKEVEALSSVYHGNIVSFIGYCEEEEYLALVYEFMPNGSLADHLKTAESSTPSILNWPGKLKIVHGAAQGLEYLHTGLSMLHMDVKSGNILLDKNFEAKVADFGMSRIFDGSTVTMTQSSICGTIGYLDPEILTGLSKKLSFPSDVYSFGVVLLEIITGQPPYSPDRGSVHIVDYVSQNPQNPNIIDPKLGDYDPECMRMVINLAMKCTQRASTDRPTMSEVVIELQQCLDVGMSLEWSTSQAMTSTTSKTILSLGNTDQTDSYSTF